MKLKLITVSCALSFGMLCAAAHSATLKIGVAAEPYPPFTYKQSNGQWTGFEIELVMNICREIKEQCQIAETSWDGIIPALDGKKIDVIFNSMSITPAREKVIAFSKPYLVSEAQYVGTKGEKMAMTPEGLKGKIIGVQSGTTHIEYAKARFGQVANIKQYNTQEELNSDLLAGRVDVMILDSIAANELLQSKQGGDLASYGLVPRDPIYGPGIGAGMRKEDVALKRKFDAAIDTLRANGSTAALYKKYLKMDMPEH